MELLDAQGQPREDPAVAAIATADRRFLNCAELSGVRLQATGARSLRAYFWGAQETRTWDSWEFGPHAPPPGALSLEGRRARELRHPHRSHAALPFPDGLVVELLLDAPVTGPLTLRFAPGPYCLRFVELCEGPLAPAALPPEPQPPAPPQGARRAPAYDQLPRRGDALAALLPPGEPSLEALWRVALPFYGHSLLGALEGPIVGGVWDGSVLLPAAPGYSGDRHALRLELNTGPVRVSGRGLRAGWLPIEELRGTAGPLRVTQLRFVDPAGTLRCRFHIDNPSGDAVRVQPALVAVFGQVQLSENLPHRRAGVYEPRACPVEPEGSFSVGPYQGRLSPAGERRLIAGGRLTLELTLPLAPPPFEIGNFDQALHRTEAYWTTFLRSGAELDLPDPRLHNLWRALLVHNRLFQRQGKMRYGVFPSGYQDMIFGVEEGWNLVAMAMYRHGAIAQAGLQATFFEPAFLAKEGQHHQYRNGLAVLYALDIYRLTHDQEFLRGLYPTVLESARWIIKSLHSTQVLVGGERPVYYGLMPKHTYGGDLRDPTYSFYGSSTCWRGLRDAALIAAVLRAPEAEELRREAEGARRNMLRVAERIIKRDVDPPLLPFRVDEPGPEPSARDYHQLFASLVLETALFGWRGEYAVAITDYLAQTGRQVFGVARFDQWFGRLGIDAEYSRGVQLAHLARRDFEKYYLGVLGQVGLSCDPDTFTSPETAVVRFSPQDHRERMRALAQDPARLDSDPCSAGTAVMLQYLRYLLCFEERDEDDLPTGALWLLPAAPASWFQPGRRFGFQELPSAFGVLSLRCEVHEDVVYMDIHAAQPLLVELFYFDRAGQRRSSRRGVSDTTRVVLPR